MTGDGVPANPSVLNTTVLSNFAYVDQLQVVASLSGICTVSVVREELENGVDDHPYLQSALDTLDDEIPVVTVSDTVGNREVVVSDHLDPGEAQAFALADVHSGRLLTDDGDARSFAKEQGVTVVGSVGVLLAAIDAGKIDESTAEEVAVDVDRRDRILRSISVDFGLPVSYAYRPPIARVVSTFRISEDGNDVCLLFSSFRLNT